MAAPGRWSAVGDPPINWQRPLAIALTVVILAFAAALFAVRWSAFNERGSFGIDLVTYQAFARRWLDTGSQYLPYQLTELYEPQPIVAPALVPSLYPPPALALFVPFLWLPRLLWWVIPLTVTIGLVRAWRPAWWSWPIIAALIATPGSVTMPLSGNTTLWALAFITAGLRFGWPASLLVIKPSLALFVLVGIRQRSFWIVGVALGLASLVLLPEWLRYVDALHNSYASLDYSLASVPTMLIPIVAWHARRPLPHRSG